MAPPAEAEDLRGLDLKVMREVASSSDRLWPPESVLELLALVNDLTLRLESKHNALKLAVDQRNEAQRQLDTTAKQLRDALEQLRQHDLTPF